MQRFLLVSVFFISIWACSPSGVKKETSGSSTLGIYPPLYIIKEQVNLRSEAGLTGNIITTLNDGDEIQVIENKNGWYHMNADDGKQGWLRSDLAGPRTMSRTRMASAFSDSILPAFRSKIFFDKTDLFRKVYLTLPASYYSSQKNASNQAEKIGKAYQQKVYPGAIDILVMRPESEELFFNLTLPAAGIAEVPIPILKHGILFDLKRSNSTVAIYVAVPVTVSDKVLLKTARDISAAYDYPFTKAEVYMVTNSVSGLRYLGHFDTPAEDKGVCRLYYLEDGDGEDYRFNFCDD